MTDFIRVAPVFPRMLFFCPKPRPPPPPDPWSRLCSLHPTRASLCFLCVVTLPLLKRTGHECRGRSLSLSSPNILYRLDRGCRLGERIPERRIVLHVTACQEIPDISVTLLAVLASIPRLRRRLQGLFAVKLLFFPLRRSQSSFYIV